jgi:hypothetical protein
MRGEGRKALTIAGDNGDEAYCESAIEQVLSGFGRMRKIDTVHEKPRDLATFLRGGSTE